MKKKLLLILALAYFLAITFFLWGYLSAKSEVFPATFLNSYYEKIQSFIENKKWKDEVKPESHVSRKQGFTQQDKSFVDDGYLLLARYSDEDRQDVAELVRLSDFSIIKKWIPSIPSLRSKTKLKIKKTWNVLWHPLLTKDGGLIFHMSSDEAYSGPLIKINRSGEVVWAVDGKYHHSLEFDHEGNIVACIYNDPPLVNFPLPQYWDNGYAVISPTGKLLKQFSVAKIMMENDFKAMLIGSGRFEYDRVHINDAQPIYNDIGEAKVGDVALSLRNLSSVMLYRPSTNKIIWEKTGPWINQHDVNALGNGEYSVFGNDMYRLTAQPSIRINDSSEVYIYNPKTEEVKSPFSQIMKKAKISSLVGGVSKILKNGDVFVESFSQNRIIRASENKVRWEYVNAPMADNAWTLRWSRYLSKEELKSLTKDHWVK